MDRADKQVHRGTVSSSECSLFSLCVMHTGQNCATTYLGAIPSNNVGRIHFHFLKDKGISAPKFVIAKSSSQFTYHILTYFQWNDRNYFYECQRILHQRP